LPSSDKIALLKASDDNPHLRKIWGGIFYHPIFVDAASRALNLKGQSSNISVEEKSIGAFNLLYRERLGLRTATTPLLFQYFGPVLYDDESMDISENSRGNLKEYLANDFDFVYFSLSPNSHLLSEFIEQFHHEKALTLVLYCDDLKKWGAGFRDDVKNKINKAKKERVQIVASDSLPQKLWEITFARRGVAPPIKPSVLADWCEPLIKENLLKIFVAQIDRTPVAFRGELIFGDYAYDWIAGSDPAHHASGANQFLMAEIGREFSAKNLTAWDMVGANIKSIADFKKSFGAREVEHLHIYRSFNVKGQIFNILRHIRHGRE
jgi:hypothetical protein